MADTQVLAPSSFRHSIVRDTVGPLPGSEDLTNTTISHSHTPRKNSIGSTSYQLTASNVLQLLQEGIAPSYQNLILPPGLLEDLTNAVWRMAVDEPCGFRGCVLNIILCNDKTDSEPKKRRTLLQLKNNTIITHKITLLLYPDTTSWFSKMARLFRPKQTVVATNFSSEVSRMCNFD